MTEIIPPGPDDVWVVLEAGTVDTWRVDIPEGWRVPLIDGLKLLGQRIADGSLGGRAAKRLVPKILAVTTALGAQTLDSDALFDLPDALSDVADLIDDYRSVDDLDAFARRAAMTADRIAGELSRSVVPVTDGTFAVRLDRSFTDAVVDLSEQVDDLAHTDHPSLARLTPPAYLDDVEKSAGYAALAGAELIERRQRAAATLREVLDSGVITRDELGPTMRAVNSLRLVLSSEIGINDDNFRPPTPLSPRFTKYLVYEYLGQLLSDLVGTGRITLGADPLPD